jgi:hypothetical protein
VNEKVKRDGASLFHFSAELRWYRSPRCLFTRTCPTALVFRSRETTAGPSPRSPEKERMQLVHALTMSMGLVARPLPALWA